MTTWILVADEFRARLFKAQAKAGPLEEIADITHPEGRMHGGEMTRDRQPRVQESDGSARHAIEPHTSVSDKVSLEFARELAERLEHGRARSVEASGQVDRQRHNPVLAGTDPQRCRR